MDYLKLYYIVIKASEKMEHKQPVMITHSLRSTFINEMAASGKSVMEIMDITGHRKESTVRYYITPTPVPRIDTTQPLEYYINNPVI